MQFSELVRVLCWYTEINSDRRTNTASLHHAGLHVYLLLEKSVTVRYVYCLCVTTTSVDTGRLNGPSDLRGSSDQFEFFNTDLLSTVHIGT